jgi:nicotinate-nucleotide--dimethylbenzimidazole phosphoribosyltransferase
VSGRTEALSALIDGIEAPDPAQDPVYWDRLDSLTKPPRSLGRLETLAVQIARIQRTTTPDVANKTVIVAAADHGVTSQGVSPYPREVTRQMVHNFAAGGAAINQIAEAVGASLVLADFGVGEHYVAVEGVRDCWVAPGTRNIASGPAMTVDECVTAIERGARLATEAVHEGARIVAIGEMGIGNTTSAAALTAGLTGAPPESVVGPGTGLDPSGVIHKLEIVHEALRTNDPRADDPLAVLASLGGLEIAGLTGVVLGCSARRCPVVVDGFIAAAAALAAVRLCPGAHDFLVASHRSSEPGHAIVLEALETSPILEMEMRLGEGSGAALALGIVDAACRVMSGMATFEEAGVTDAS